MKAHTLELPATSQALPGQGNAQLSKFFLGVLGSLLTAAICANTAMLFQFGERLTRLETKLELLAEKTHIAKSP